MQTGILVLFAICTFMNVAKSNGDLTVSGTTITYDLAISGLPCTGGTLTTDSMGIVSCSDPGCSLSACFATGLAVLTCGDSSLTLNCVNAGFTWTSRVAESNSWYSATYGSGVFVAVATSGLSQVMTAPQHSLHFNVDKVN